MVLQMLIPRRIRTHCWGNLLHQLAWERKSRKSLLIFFAPYLASIKCSYKRNFNVIVVIFYRKMITINVFCLTLRHETMSVSRKSQSLVCKENGQTCHVLSLSGCFPFFCLRMKLWHRNHEEHDLSNVILCDCYGKNILYTYLRINGRYS